MTEEVVELNAVQKYEALLAEYEAARRNRDVDIDTLLQLGSDVKAAKGAALAFKSEETRAAREALTAEAQSQIKTLICSFDWASVSVERVGCMYNVADGTLSISPSVPGVSKVRAKGESSGGARSRKTYSADGQTFNSRELVEKYGPRINAERTQTVLADSAKGLSHFADEIAKKVNATVSQS